MRNIVKAVHVRAIRASSPRGLLAIGNLAFPCALGRAGMAAIKREGDGKTPIGRWKFGTLLWRPDRRGVPATALPVRPLRRGMGWCDAPGDRNYNRPVQRPYPASHEDMWRSDGLYDVVVTLSHNSRPRVAGFGSAVFFHVASDDLGPTAGCIAVRRHDMAKVLRYFGPETVLVIAPAPRFDVRKPPSRSAPGWRRRQ